jgi:octaprenyl-diphosphate synthase
VTFRAFGERLGVAFQIVDDLFDYLGDPEVTGKPMGSDLAEGKVTLPLIAALREASEVDRRRLKRLALRQRWTVAQWNQLRALIEKCGGFAYARECAESFAGDSRRLLDEALGPGGSRSAPAVAARRALGQAVGYAVRRDH